jgi:hypothetical protein
MPLWQILLIGLGGLFLKYAISVILTNIAAKEDKSVLEKRTYGELVNKKSDDDKNLLEKRVYGRKEGNILC